MFRDKTPISQVIKFDGCHNLSKLKEMKREGSTILSGRDGKDIDRTENIERGLKKLLILKNIGVG